MYGLFKVREPQNRKGFTLTELLVTIAIIAVVAAISIPIINNVIETSKREAIAADQEQINAFIAKYNKSGGYTYDGNGKFVGYVDKNGDGIASEDEKLEELIIDERFGVVVTVEDAPSNPQQISFNNPPLANFIVVGYKGKLTPPSLTVTGQAGIAIDPTSVSIADFVEPYSWSITSGTLPSGLSLNPSTGVVSGTPVVATNEARVVITVTDANGVKSSQEHLYSFTAPATLSPETQNIIGQATLPITPTTVSIENFTEPYSWSVTSGTLPEGLTLNTETGVVSGTPTQPTSETTVVITISDAAGNVKNQIHNYEFAAEPMVTPETQSISGVVGVDINPTTASLSGFQGATTWRVSAGTLPSGLSLNVNTGVVSGTPTATYPEANVVLEVEDDRGVKRTQVHTYTVSPAPTVSPTSVTVSGLSGQAITPTSVSTSNFVAPVVWTVTSGTLPTGLSLNSTTGSVSGTPTQAVTGRVVVITATDSRGLTRTQTHTYNIAAPEIVVVDYGVNTSGVTGGWYYDDCWNPPGTSRVGTTGSFFYQDSNGLSINAPYWGCGTASSNNNVNLAGVTSATITFSWSGVAYYGNSSVDWQLADGSRAGYTFRGLSSQSSQGLTTITVPITNGGNGKVNFGAGNTNGGRFYLHQLKFNY